MKTKIFGLLALLLIISCSTEDESVILEDDFSEISDFALSPEEFEQMYNDLILEFGDKEAQDRNFANNNCSNPAILFLDIVWNNPALPESQKQEVRTFFEVNYGKTNVTVIYGDGSERWVFIRENVNETSLNGNNCVGDVIRNAVDAHDEVENED